jgi:hypothetical protein
VLELLRLVFTSSLLGLMADDPDLIDRACALAYEARDRARKRTIVG